MTAFTDDDVDWTKGGGLVPAIVQDAASLRVLMLGYMNREALAATRQTKLVTFYSRDRKKLWQKGETSGNTLHLVGLELDCDRDTLLVRATPAGPTCHTGERTCFGPEDTCANLAVLADLESVIRQRRAEGATGTSYTARLFAAGLPRMAQKVGEEGVEVALAAVTQSSTLADESADLLYHLLVVLEARGANLSDVLNVLHARAHPSAAPSGSTP